MTLSTRAFLRKELRKERLVSFRLSQRDYQDVFMPVVESVAQQHGRAGRGQIAAVMRVLLKQALQENRQAQKSNEWQEKEAQFVEFTREQQSIIATLRSEIRIQELEIQRIQSEYERLSNAYQKLCDAASHLFELIKNPG